MKYFSLFIFNIQINHLLSYTKKGFGILMLFFFAINSRIDVNKHAISGGNISNKYPLKFYFFGI